MKKIILVLAVVCGISVMAEAQKKNALGMNLSLPNLNPEISYVRSLGKGNQALDFSLGLQIKAYANDAINDDPTRSTRITAAAFYDFNFKIGNSGLSWYVAPGMFMGYATDDFRFGLGGNIGVSYGFNIPLSVNLQYGARVDVTQFDEEKTDPWLYDVFSLGFRYAF